MSHTNNSITRYQVYIDCVLCCSYQRWQMVSRDTRKQIGVQTILKSLGMRAMGLMGTYEGPLTLSLD